MNVVSKVGTWIFPLLLLASLGTVSSAAEPGDFAGTWEGFVVFEPGKNEIDLIVRLEHGAGGWSGDLTIPSSTWEARPLSDIVIEGKNVQFSFPSGENTRSIRGTLAAGGEKMDAEYVRDDSFDPLVLQRVAKSFLDREPRELRDLSSGGKELREQFQKDKDKLRVLLMLSPRCLWCKINSRMIEYHLLNEAWSDDLRVYVVWQPILKRDSREEAVQSTRFMVDERVTHFWTDDHVLGDSFKPAVDLEVEGETAWDLFMVYYPGTEWGEKPPKPDFFMHNWDELPAELELNARTFADKVEAMLEECTSCSGKNDAE